MKNFVQPGNTITLTAPYAVASGDGLLVGYIFGVVRKAAFPPETKNWLYWLALCAYCFNFLAISIDVGLYFRNTKLDKIAAQTKN